MNIDIIIIGPTGVRETEAVIPDAYECVRQDGIKEVIENGKLA